MDRAGAMIQNRPTMVLRSAECGRDFGASVGTRRHRLFLPAPLRLQSRTFSADLIRFPKIDGMMPGSGFQPLPAFAPTQILELGCRNDWTAGPLKPASGVSGAVMREAEVRAN